MMRFDERSCATRLQNEQKNEGLKKVLPENIVAQFRAGLLAVQAWKKERGIELDTPDLSGQSASGQDLKM